MRGGVRRTAGENRMENARGGGREGGKKINSSATAVVVAANDDRMKNKCRITASVSNVINRLELMRDFSSAVIESCIPRTAISRIRDPV